jgi:CheY-like chemotaxis protein/DNA-binding transcriptional regulator YiaG
MAMSVTEQHKSVYAYIGQRIRERRKLLRFSQTELAELMGFSYQQIQKYEAGTSHLTAGKLLLFAKVLNVPPNYFYEGIRLDEDVGQRIETDIIQKPKAGPLRILLVEDNPADVILFKKALAVCSERVEIHIIHDAEAVMDYLQNHLLKFGHKLPDIIVLDLSMPKLSGIELLRSIKKHPRAQLLPVVILTNSVSVKNMVECYKSGASGYIQKSVDMEEYKESVEVVIKYWSRVVALPCA